MKRMWSTVLVMVGAFVLAGSLAVAQGKVQKKQEACVAECKADVKDCNTLCKKRMKVGDSECTRVCNMMAQECAKDCREGGED